MWRRRIIRYTLRHRNKPVTVSVGAANTVHRGDNETTSNEKRTTFVYYRCPSRLILLWYVRVLLTRRRRSLCLRGPTVVEAWWGGPAPGGIEAARVRVCRRWRGATNRLAAAVCRCRMRPNGWPAVRRQSPFEPFPAHREQLLSPPPHHLTEETRSRNSQIETVTVGSAPKIGFLRVLVTHKRAHSAPAHVTMRALCTPLCAHRKYRHRINVRALLVFFKIYFTFSSRSVYTFITRFFTRKMEIHYFSVYMNSQYRYTGIN